MKITAIVGTYRKGGVIDAAVDTILAAAKGKGAQVEKVYLVDRRVEFCTNCRTCTQKEGVSRGRCVIEDDMAEILALIEDSDAVVLASPMNNGTVTAVMKRFIERLIGYAYWPWGKLAPKPRREPAHKAAVIVTACAAPGFFARFPSGMVKLLKSAATLLGCATVRTLSIGLAARKPDQKLGRRARRRAVSLGEGLATGKF